ncbi:retinal-binding protein-like isoform X1 [Mytilus trossulus]|uniref:retinal-binding protein-like isoform X1 n=1 Tax=Mytilus trossulus TaxID=6551 RepID=UPI00300705F6
MNDINANNSYNRKPLSPKEQKALLQLQENTKDIADQNSYDLEKWLRARCFDVKKAEQMLRNSIEFKQKIRVNTLLQEYKPPEVLRKYLTGGFCGHAIDGSPLRVELFGKLDIKGLMFSTKKSDLEKTKLLQCESTIKDWSEQSKKLGRPVDGLTVIFDMADTGTSMLWVPGMQMYLHLVKILEDNYPEMMRRLLVINAPRIFPLLYKIARPLISDEMKQKIHVKGDDYKDLLLRYVDPDNLPACYGGKLTDPDGNPKCVTKICQGGTVPEKYYLQNSDNISQMQSATVPRGDKLYLEYRVDKPGSVISWEFQSEDHDVGFGLLYEENEKYEIISKVTRVNSHHVLEDGVHTCEKTGKYFLCFDNSFSWTRSKKIRYVCEVIAPDDTLISQEINKLIEDGDWETLSERFETTHL